MRKNLHHARKNLPQISVQLAHKIVTLVKIFQRVDAILKLFCLWSGIHCQLPISRHARVFVQARLSRDCRQHSLVGQVVFCFCICSVILLAQPKRRILSSIVIGTMPSYRCSSVVEVCLFFFFACCSSFSSSLQEDVLPDCCGIFATERARSL